MKNKERKNDHSITTFRKNFLIFTQKTLSIYKKLHDEKKSLLRKKTNADTNRIKLLNRIVKNKKFYFPIISFGRISSSTYLLDHLGDINLIQNPAHEKRILAIYFPLNKELENDQELFGNFIMQLRVFVNGFKAAELKKFFNANKNKKEENLKVKNDLVDWVTCKLCNLQTSKEKRKMEQTTIKKLNFEQIFYSFGDTVIPLDVMKLIFSYLSTGKIMLNSVGLVNENFYILSLLSFRNFVFNKTNVMKVPILVLNSLESIFFDFSRKFTNGELSHVFLHLKNVKSIGVNKAFPKILKISKEMKSQITKTINYLYLGKLENNEYDLEWTKQFPNLEKLSIDSNIGYDETVYFKNIPIVELSSSYFLCKDEGDLGDLKGIKGLIINGQISQSFQFFKSHTFLSRVTKLEISIFDNVLYKLDLLFRFFPNLDELYLDIVSIFTFNQDYLDDSAYHEFYKSFANLRKLRKLVFLRDDVFGFKLEKHSDKIKKNVIFGYRFVEDKLLKKRISPKKRKFSSEHINFLKTLNWLEEIVFVEKRYMPKQELTKQKEVYLIKFCKDHNIRYKKREEEICSKFSLDFVNRPYSYYSDQENFEKGRRNRFFRKRKYGISIR